MREVLGGRRGGREEEKTGDARRRQAARGDEGEREVLKEQWAGRGVGRVQQWTKVRIGIISWGRRLMESGVVWFGEPLWFLLRWQISCAHNVHRLVKVTCLKSAARRRSRGVMADPDGWANGGIVAFELGLLPSTYENNTCIRRRSMS